MKYLIILFITSVLLSCSSDQDNLTKNFNNVEITFKGYDGVFHKKNTTYN